MDVTVTTEITNKLTRLGENLALGFLERRMIKMKIYKFIVLILGGFILHI